MEKKIVIETACLIAGHHVNIGEAVAIDPDTADMLVRHGKASFPPEKAAKPAKPD